MSYLNLNWEYLHNFEMGMNKWKFNQPFEMSILVDNVHSEQALAVLLVQLNSLQICDGK